MTEDEEISIYEKAAENNLDFIMELIRKHPDFIDRPCQYENTRRYKTARSAVASVLSAVGFLFTIVSLPPVGYSLAAAQMYFGVSSIHNQTTNERNRTNWTLLSYAAEAGATAVAVWLISRGADITNSHFIL